MSNIKVEKHEFWAKITLSKPPLNILSTEDLIDLKETFKNLGKQEKLRLIVIDSDQKIFSAGVDIAEHAKDRFEFMISAFDEVFKTLLRINIPTLSLVKSDCYGGGSDLALFCDLSVASENAAFCFPEVKLGCYSPITLSFLPQLTGNKKALEYILTGNKIPAKEAFLAGLINNVFKEEEFEQKSQELINSIISNSSCVIKATLKAYRSVNFPNLEEKIALIESIYSNELVNSEDAEEGMKSFLEKRPPLWKDK